MKLTKDQPLISYMSIKSFAQCSTFIVKTLCCSLVSPLCVTLLVFMYMMVVCYPILANTSLFYVNILNFFESIVHLGADG